MKKIILLLLLSGLSSSALAEWVEVVKEDGLTILGNPATVRRQGNLVRMWDMSDYGSKQKLTGNSYLSKLLFAEYDCANEKYRSLYLSVHKENSGDGNLLYATDVDDFWRPVPPGSVAENLLKFACEKSNLLNLSY